MHIPHIIIDILGWATLGLLTLLIAFVTFLALQPLIFRRKLGATRETDSPVPRAAVTADR